MIKRALISVYDKTGVAGFAKKLASLGVEIISTGGTAKAIYDAGVSVVEVESLTGFPECLGGRLKTLHPKIHGGLLADRSNPGHMRQMSDNGVEMIDLVAVNLYPFKKTIEKPDVSLAEAIEQIDIGGPAMLRSAAKNFRDVAVITDPDDYAAVLGAIETSGEVPYDFRLKLALKVFEHTAGYDALIAGYLAGAAYGRGRQSGPGADIYGGPPPEGQPDAYYYFPEKLTLTFEKKQRMRYGENPHQSAAFYADPIPAAGSLATYAQLHGKELSYNNINDLDGALGLLEEFDEPAAVAVKHANPCGAATAGDIYGAYMKAYESDTTSIFGGVIVLNRPVDLRTAAEIRKLFIEIVAAPGFDDDALKLLMKKKNIRLLIIDVRTAAGRRAERTLYIKKVGGGLLAQTNDNSVLAETGTDNAPTADSEKLFFVTDRRPTDKEFSDLLFAMTVVKHTKSNAIAIAKDGATVGVGPGQNSRISAAKIAIEVAGARAVSAAAASDAYIPFNDCIDAFAAAGITSVIQPGGSVNDAEAIEACNRYGIAMVFTNVRHFKH